MSVVCVNNDNWIENVCVCQCECVWLESIWVPALHCRLAQFFLPFLAFPFDIFDFSVSECGVVCMCQQVKHFSVRECNVHTDTRVRDDMSLTDVHLSVSRPFWLDWCAAILCVYSGGCECGTCRPVKFIAPTLVHTHGHFGFHFGFIHSLALCTMTHSENVCARGLLCESAHCTHSERLTFCHLVSFRMAIKWPRMPLCGVVCMYTMERELSSGEWSRVLAHTPNDTNLVAVRRQIEKEAKCRNW